MNKDKRPVVEDEPVVEPVVKVVKQDDTFEIGVLRQHCRVLFRISAHTFDGVLHYNNLKLTDCVTKVQFADYVVKFQNHAVTI